MEEELGLLLPCNVIVSVIEPEAMLSVVDRDEMQAIAGHVRGLLSQALAKIIQE